MSDAFAITSKASPTSHTNILQVRLDRNRVLFESAEELEAIKRAEEADKESGRLEAVHEAEAESLRDQLSAAEERSEELESLLAEFKDGEGITPIIFRQRTLDAEELSRKHVALARSWGDEVEKMRKRKGYFPGYFSQMREILQILTELEHTDPRCKTILSKIRQ